ncbi:N-acetylneuraminate synthase family protein, partial [Candidatus Pelagibacter sp.]|nr:N-acetylneuraminate synthase family protein [Candidatus Pelagibacter sp.]
MAKELKIGKVKIGEKHPPVLFPDIGTFFNQDIKLAEKLILKLINDGAKIIKGEILHNPDIALKTERKEPYLSDKRKIIKENLRKIIERKILPLSTYEKIFSVCKKKKVDFILSVYDFEGASFAKEIGSSALKIASSNITHKPLIEYVCKLGLPVILDTGKSSYDEIKKSISWFKRNKFSKLHLQHSPYAPPHSLKKHDLLMIKTFLKKFDFTVGLSDHHNSNIMLYAAVALGASTVEKGIKTKLIKNDQDVYHAMDIEDFKLINKNLIEIKIAMGKSMRVLKKNDPKHLYRMGIIAKETIKNGTKLKANNLTFAFPKKGVPVEEFDKIL